MTNEALTEQLSDKIIHVLSLYHRISPSMLQMGVGSNLSPNFWRPVLEELIASGTVKQEYIVSLAPSGRHQTYTIISLTDSSQLVS